MEIDKMAGLVFIEFRGPCGTGHLTFSVAFVAWCHFLVTPLTLRWSGVLTVSHPCTNLLALSRANVHPLAPRYAPAKPVASLFLNSIFQSSPVFAFKWRRFFILPKK